MIRESKKWNRFFFFTLSLVFSWMLTFSWGWSQTYVSGKVITSDGMVVTSGAVALEKGELHNNAFRVGGGINVDGTFKIPATQSANLHENEFTTIHLPKLKTIEEREESLKYARQDFKSNYELPEEKQKYIRELIHNERKFLEYKSGGE